MPSTESVTDPRKVSRAEWLDARKALLAKEKELTRQRDQLAEERRRLPWVRVDERYVFDHPQGRRTLADLFDGRSQLVVYHLMFAPEWEAACKSCSFWADQLERNVVHLKARDVTLMAASRAPLPKLAAYARRMGWTFDWISTGGTTFNQDYGVWFTPEEMATNRVTYNYEAQAPDATDLPGFSVFVKDADGAVYHTYSCYSRGIDAMNAAYQILDLTPKGRDEAAPARFMTWLRRRDEYGTK